jgi:hypothetical protein
LRTVVETRQHVSKKEAHVALDQFARSSQKIRIAILSCRSLSTRQKPTTQLLKYIRRQKEFQATYLRTAERNKKKHNVNRNDTTLLQLVMEIIDQFDFIALVERMDESLVVMKLLFGLEDKDMIVLSAKSSGGYDDGKLADKCF